MVFNMATCIQIAPNRYERVGGFVILKTSFLCLVELWRNSYILEINSNWIKENSWDPKIFLSYDFSRYEGISNSFQAGLDNEITLCLANGYKYSAITRYCSGSITTVLIFKKQWWPFTKYWNLDEPFSGKN